MTKYRVEKFFAFEPNQVSNKYASSAQEFHQPFKQRSICRKKENSTIVKAFGEKKSYMRDFLRKSLREK